MAIKVKQSTIDEIKKMGMTKALASAKTRRSPEFQEALRRMYGQRRLDAAMKGATGGSMPKATYMYKGTSSGATTTKRKKMTMGSTPGAPAGTGARQKPGRKKSSRAGAVAAATGAAGAAGIYAKGKSVQKKVAQMKPKELKAYKAKLAARGEKLAKFAKSPAGKLVGKASRLATGKTAMGAAALYGASKYGSAVSKAAKETEKRRKAGMTDKSAGGARATAMKKSRGR